MDDGKTKQKKSATAENLFADLTNILYFDHHRQAINHRIWFNRFLFQKSKIKISKSFLFFLLLSHMKFIFEARQRRRQQHILNK